MSKAKEIIELFKTHGEIIYGEVMSVNSHSFQAGIEARNQGFDQLIQLAAFLHDIGHILPLSVEELSGDRMGEFGMEQHDLIGAQYLKNSGCPPLVVACAQYHVAAKRYLCFADPNYMSTLSFASQQTLSYQGGPLNEKEARKFENLPFFTSIITVRKIDELAKKADFSITAEHWQYFEDILNYYLV